METRLETDIWGKHRIGGGGGGDSGCAKQAPSWWVVPFDLWPCFAVTNQAPRGRAKINFSMLESTVGKRKDGYLPPGHSRLLTAPFLVIQPDTKLRCFERRS